MFNRRRGGFPSCLAPHVQHAVLACRSNVIIPNSESSRQRRRCRVSVPDPCGRDRSTVMHMLTWLCMYVPSSPGYSGVSFDSASTSLLETQAERLIRELRKKREMRNNERLLEEEALPANVTHHRASVAQGLKAYAQGLASLADFDAHKKYDIPTECGQHWCFISLYMALNEGAVNPSAGVASFAASVCRFPRILMPPAAPPPRLCVSCARKHAWADTQEKTVVRRINSSTKKRRNSSTGGTMAPGRSAVSAAWRDFERVRTSSGAIAGDTTSPYLASSAGGSQFHVSPRPQWSSGIPSSDELIDAAMRAREPLAAVVSTPSRGRSPTGRATGKHKDKSGPRDGTRLTFGAALLAQSGKVHSGASVHGGVSTASGGLAALPAESAGLCAERIAVVKAVSDGDTQFECLYLFSDYPHGFVAPCPECMYAHSRARCCCRVWSVVVVWNRRLAVAAPTAARMVS